MKEAKSARNTSQSDAGGKELFTSSELRIIAISLSVLSLGLALAWLGFALFIKG